MTAHQDPATFGMTIVTQAQFFAYVNPRDVHPSVQGSSKGPYGLYSDWKLQRTGQLIGKSFGHGDNAVWMLKTELIGT